MKKTSGTRYFYLPKMYPRLECRTGYDQPYMTSAFVSCFDKGLVLKVRINCKNLIGYRRYLAAYLWHNRKNFRK